ncbi:carboxylesterase/lipase family protein [Pantoea anthophila]|uniref:carboxylesterase/lipase family protein n=1 Tax=Pantoea anthophila TaxID=470931 RepID=UPI002DBF670B|nr:carboxylesterase/lipase family protein [Pantoea anthophila]MEB5704631.1 carboxylesterase/lipase family protein [Pantoea anthophila]MEB6515504.1 carboxylesterase/lipase family protein [Pantoea anthophila]
MKNETGLRIMTAEGELRGSMDDDLFVFKGIPYAAPPEGALRWRPPQPVTPWQQVRDATQFGASGWQNRAWCEAVGGGNPGEFSEDCLYLNVWTPDVEPARPLPVMVWLHGGGFTIGAGGLAPYNGKSLASRGAVVVTLNYRLGHLGFFSHPALDAEYPVAGTVNNFGLLDQIAALQWVQRNIPAFGGDRRNVTLFGESAGARSVLSLCCSPLAEGLFHKGIVQSAYSLPDTPLKKARQQGVAVARHFGLPPDVTAEQLRALPADAFWSLEGTLAIPPVPIAGDAVLPEPMLKTFLAAKQHRLPLMAGSNSDEASVLDYFGVDATAVLHQLRDKNRLTYRTLKWMYDIHDDRLLGRAVARDMAFSLMPWLVMRAQYRVGMPGWRYWFDYVSEHARDLYPHGAWHGNEVPYVLDTLSQMPDPNEARPFSEADRAFAAQVSDYWFRFARDATEYTHQLDGEVVWPAWHPGNDVTMSLGDDRQHALKLKRNFMRARLRLFRLLMTRMVRL